MEFRAIDNLVLNWTGDALAIGFLENAVDLSGDLAQLDDKFAGALKELITETEFKGSVGSSATTRVGGGSQIRKIIIVGLGKQEAVKLDGWRRAAAVVARLARKEKCKTLGISLPVWDDDPGAT